MRPDIRLRVQIVPRASSLRPPQLAASFISGRSRDVRSWHVLRYADLFFVLNDQDLCHETSLTPLTAELSLGNTTDRSPQ
jgi:hypothetical protein